VSPITYGSMDFYNIDVPVWFANDTAR